MHWVIRGIVGLWAVFFGWTGLTGLVDSAVYSELFGVVGDAMVMNTIRADLSSFFIVSSVAAGWAALRPDMHRLLYIPAALFGTAMVGRILGVMMGDPFTGVIQSSIITEGVSLALMVASARLLGRTATSS